MWWLWGKGESGFSSSSTAEEVTDGINGSGLTAIVTGGSSGIGAETVRVLALRGVHVIMGVRNTAAGMKVKEEIVEKDRDAKIEVMELDLSSIASVRKFASKFISKDLPLNILINNAGIVGTPFMLSEDNIELQFATNHIGHFLLTKLLLDVMKRTSLDTKKEGRIVNVSSANHSYSYHGGIRFDKINDPAGYKRFIAYSQSKLANILHANELARRLKEEGVELTVNSVHPGLVATAIFRDLWFIDGLIKKLSKYVVKNVEQGAATTCYVALHPQAKGYSGEYFSNSNLGKASSQARDADLARKLWNLSEKLVK